LRSENENGDQLPGSVFGSVGAMAVIVVSQTLSHVLGEADVILIGMGHAADDVNVIKLHGLIPRLLACQP
jgi:hypothetical protein